MKLPALHWQILLAILLAAITGHFTGVSSGIFGTTFYQVFDFGGTLFINALKMLIIPLIVSSIIAGMANVGIAGISRLGGKTFFLYLLTSLLAIIAGLIFVNLTTPGLIGGMPAGAAYFGLEQNSPELMKYITSDSQTNITDVFLRMIPPNIINAASNGKMLGLIFFSLLFGLFINKLSSKKSELLQGFWQGVFEVMMHITMWVMKFAPYGVFMLVAKTVAHTGFSALKPLLVFFITVLAALGTHLFVNLFVLLKLFGHTSPTKHFRLMLPALLTAFSTASSSATLPVTMETVENRLGVSNRTTSFILPLGATINMDGTALYECVAAIFIAQVYGLDLTFVQQFIVVFVALVTSIGVAGVPAASLVAISVILGAIGLPLEGIGLLLITDRLLDMCRTALNVFSDSCVAVIVASWQGERTKSY